MKSFRSFFVLSLILAAGFLQAQEPGPFVDMNDVVLVVHKKDQIILHTTQGRKALDLVTGKWSYAQATSAPTATPDPLTPVTYGPPAGWVHVGQGDPGDFNYTLLRGSELSAPMTLYQHIAWEPPDVSSYYLTDYRTKQNLMLPLDLYIRGGMIYQEKAWLGTQKGLLTVDLKTGKMTLYQTYPLLPALKEQPLGDSTIFLSASGCYLLTAGKTFVPIQPVPAGGSLEYLDMAATGEKVFYLTSGPGDGGFPAFGKQSLFSYDVKSGKTERYLVPVDYANHLELKGKDLLGYGSYYAIDEENGSYYIMKGGAFILRDGEAGARKLTGLPVTELDPETLDATAIHIEASSDFRSITRLKYVPEKGVLKAVSSELICTEDDGGSKFKEYNGREYKVLAAPRHHRRLSKAELEALKVGKAGERPADHSDRTCVYETIATDLGTCPIHPQQD